MSKVIAAVSMLIALATGAWSCLDFGETCVGETDPQEESSQWSGHQYAPPHRIKSVFFVDVSGEDSESPAIVPPRDPVVSSGVQANPYLGEQ